MEKQLLLVVGAPRSGTTWLHQMLGAHPATVSLKKELTVFTYMHLWARHYEAEKSHIDQGRWQQGAPLLYSEQEFYAGLRMIADHAYQRLLKMNPAATHILDKHPAYAQWLPLIKKIYPTAKVIHIIRDGREVAVSMMSAKKRIGFGAGDIVGASVDWVRHVRAAKKAGAEWGPKNYLEVQYEALRAEPTKSLAAVFSFSELPIHQADLDRISFDFDISRKQLSRGDTSLNELRNDPAAIWKSKLNVRERWLMDQIAGGLLQELGYARPEWWALSPIERVQMSIYPWLKRMHNLYSNGKRTWSAPVVPKLERP